MSTATTACSPLKLSSSVLRATKAPNESIKSLSNGILASLTKFETFSFQYFIKLGTERGLPFPSTNSLISTFSGILFHRARSRALSALISSSNKSNIFFASSFDAATGTPLESF